MWNQRAKNKCQYVDEADGVFWMSLEDFMENFTNLYICRVLNDWFKEEIEDEWIGESAEGLPSQTNRNAKLELNPQYDIYLTAPGPLFIQMTQYDKVNMFKGKHFMMYFIQKSDGGKIVRMDRKAILGMSGSPTNLNVVSSEIALGKTNTFPMTVTLLAGNTAHGPDGEGKFEIKIFSMSKITVKKL